VSIEQLRQVLIQKQYDGPESGKTPTEFGLAHCLASFSYGIFVTEDAEYQKKTAERFGYPEIGELQVDAAQLVTQFQETLSIQEWETMFESVAGVVEQIVGT